MQGETKEKWMILCEQAAAEQDPQKLQDLVKQINDLLEAKERRLGNDTTPRPRDLHWMKNGSQSLWPDNRFGLT